MEERARGSGSTWAVARLAAIVEPDALWVIIHANGRTYGVKLLYAELEDLGVLATDGAMGRWRRSTLGLTGALPR